MARYEFRLETLRKVRLAKRDQARSALSEAFRAADVLAAKRAELAAEAVELRHVQRSAAAGRYLDVNRLLEVQRYELLLRSRGEELAKQGALLSAEIERRRQLLVEADRDVRVLELLDERHRREHDRRQARLETKQLDETAVLRWRAR
ncbi:MAG: flagellar export protein FliJ [Pirellulales bacterium]